MNRVTLLGNVGGDPEVRTFDSGDKVANFSLATSERWKDRETGEKKEHTEWHRVVVFGPLVGVIDRYVKKGDKIMIEGQVRTRKWQDQSGQDRYATEIVLRGPKASLEMVGGRGGGDQEQSQADAYRDGPGAQGGGADQKGGAGFDDEIPF
jgi:single-strand DNA-binding protein